MTIANNDAPSVGKNADDFRALAVVLERIELRVDALLSAAAVRALNGARRSAQEDPVRLSWLQAPGLKV